MAKWRISKRPARKEPLKPLVIGIERLCMKSSVGIYPAEKRKLQKLFISATLTIKNKPINIDAMASSVDYDALCGIIRETVEKRHYELIENLALTIALTLKDESQASTVKVCIEKPLAAQKNGAESIYAVVEV